MRRRACRRSTYPPPWRGWARRSSGANARAIGMSRRSCSPCFVGLAGLFDLFVGVFPEYDRGVEQFAPHAVKGIAAALLAPIGLGLVVIARGLARRKRRAWLLAVVLLGGSAAIHLVHSVNYGAAATALVALALIARRDDFAVRGDRAHDSRILLRALLLGFGIYAYGAATLWTNRLMADQPFSLGFAWRETSAALFGLTVRGSPHLAGDFGQWFPLSIALLGTTALAIVLAGWLAPWRYRHRHEAHERKAGAGARPVVGRGHARAVRPARRQVVLLQP